MLLLWDGYVALDVHDAIAVVVHLYTCTDIRIIFAINSWFYQDYFWGVGSIKQSQ